MARGAAENSLPLQAPETLSSRRSAADRATAPDRSIRRQRLAHIQPPPSHRFAAGPSLPRKRGRVVAPSLACGGGLGWGLVGYQPGFEFRAQARDRLRQLV